MYSTVCVLLELFLVDGKEATVDVGPEWGTFKGKETHSMLGILQTPERLISN